MSSSAHVKSHPLHPMLIAFPLTFIGGMLVADLIGLVADSPIASSTAAYLSVAALVTGAVAAIPGLIDYFFKVPPASWAKKRATTHMLMNGSALIAVAGGMAFRDWGSLEPGGVAILLELVSVGLVSYGGWLGGTRGKCAQCTSHGSQVEVKNSAVKAGPAETLASSAVESDGTTRITLPRA